MNVPLRSYRLIERGEAGLACDENGVSLGGVDLARVRQDASGAVRCEVRSPGELGRIMQAAYGSLADVAVLRLHRGLSRAAASLEAKDLARAGIEAVMLGLPELTSEAMSKLAKFADLEKGANAAWETEPRVPAGQAGGGQWTTGAGSSAPVGPATNASTPAWPEGVAHAPPPSSSEAAGGASARGDSGAVGAIDESLLIPISTASAVAGARGISGGLDVPEGVARLGPVALLAYAADLLDKLDAASARAEITKAIARFGLDPTRPADVIAAAAYVWAQGNLGFYTGVNFSGPALDAASQAVMRCALIHPGAVIAMLDVSPSLGEASINLIVGAANAGLADYALESRARPAGVAPELQTTSRAARAAIAEQLKSGRMQAHHLVPAYNWGQRVDISTLARKNGWLVDGPSNLIALPADPAAQAEFEARYAEWLPVHQGSHSSYNNDTANLILKEEAKFPPNLTPLQAQAIMDEVARINRFRLKSGYYGPWVKVGA